MTKIAASILSADFANLQRDCTRLMDEGVDVLHFDVMDGHFVPNISYGAPVLRSLHAALPDVFYDVHLMISDPARYAADFARAGAGLITFHLEAVPDTVEEVVAAIRATGCQVGLSIRPGTPVEAVYPYLGVVDLILVMERRSPVSAGRSSCPPPCSAWPRWTPERRRRGCTTLLEVDGRHQCRDRPPVRTGRGRLAGSPAIRCLAPKTPPPWCVRCTAWPEPTKGETDPPCPIVSKSNAANSTGITATCCGASCRWAAWPGTTMGRARCCCCSRACSRPICATACWRLCTARATARASLPASASPRSSYL